MMHAYKPVVIYRFFQCCKEAIRGKQGQPVFKLLKNICFILLCVMLFTPPCLAAAPVISLEANDNSETIIINTGAAEAQKIFFLESPNRLVVDLPLERAPKVSLPSPYQGQLIQSVRSGQFDPQTVRLVFELTSPATLVSKAQTKDGITITIAQEGSTKSIRKTASNKKSKTLPKPEKPMIVIDPGHGGQDPGTIGARSTREKDIVLQYAKALKAALLKTGKYRVKLTRDTDVFIVLRDRVKIARANKATIFISLHADSSPMFAARGLSVYTVSEKASDAEAEALAARENKVDVLADMDLSEERQDVADILISLAQRETKNQSSILADHLVAALGERVHLLENTHRFAGFAVLKAPDVPSVLVETGFLSHKEEEKMLKTKNYQDKLVAGIVAGIDAYFQQNPPKGAQ